MSLNQDQIDRFKKQISNLIEVKGFSLKDAAEEVKADAIAFGLPEDRFKYIDLAVEQYEKDIQQVEILHEVNVLRRKDREPWYKGPSDEGFWSVHKQYLLQEKGWPDEAVGKIDKSSTSIISLLENPGRPRFSTRGLVVGFVQSGKTANMTGVMAKAADSNFRFFLVLSGMTDALREQTQARLEADLVNLDIDRWHLWTTIDADFVETVKPGFPAIQPAYRQLAVVKKNKGVLTKFLKKLENTDPSILRNLPVMIIDDECDQASVNSARYMDEMTAINGLVRTISHKLPRASYIGYTATPFANVLIDPTIRVDEGHIDDLYPKDFIVSLPRPDEYFGAEKLFGRDLLEHDDEHPDEHGLDMIREVDSNEIPLLRPGRRQDREIFSPEITPSLERAILYYILAVAARSVRGDQDKHSSMLVHTTVYVDPHFAAQKVIKAFVVELTKSVRNRKTALLQKLRAIWDEEHPRVESSRFGLDPVGFDTLDVYLDEVLESIEVAVENSGSEERLDFSPVKIQGKTRGRRFIVVGGSVLARGLTIEGLIVSFFVRSSSQYDTLMQMGRWFGYRPDYQDLPRVWMPADLEDAFHDLATVEAEIRYDIDVYEREELTPLEFAVRIRQIPGMAITARNKMLYAEDCSVSYSNEHVQTRKFRHNDRNWLENNWMTGVALVNQALDHGCVKSESDKGVWIGDIPVKYVIAFLESYAIHEDHEDMNAQRMIEYIHEQNEKSKGAMALWNLGVVEPGDGKPSDEVLGGLGKVKTVVRSRHRLTTRGDADIKALMSKADIMIDITGGAARTSESWADLKDRRGGDDGRAKPLLLFYSIDKVSQPARSEKRQNLDAVMDVLGIGIVFPRARPDTPVRYKRVELPETEYEEPEIELEET